LTVNGTIDINTIAAGTSDYDKFLVSDSGVVKYRTGAQVLSDIGGAVVNPVATDTIWDAAGDIIYGTGSNTGARLAKGTATQVLTMNAGATAPEWATGGVGDASVTQAKLKTSTHEQSTGAETWTEKVLTYADYGFNCKVKGSMANVGQFKRSDETNPILMSTSYVGESVWLKASLPETTYVIYRYVTSSGEVFWVWLLRDKETGKITDADCCSDHCGWGLEDPNDRPHPFKNYDPDKHEILLFNPTAAELTEILAKKTKKRSVLQIVLEDYEPEENTKREWPKIPVTFDIEDDNWEEKLFTGKEASIRQAVINPVPYVKTVGMKRRK